MSNRFDFALYVDETLSGAIASKREKIEFYDLLSQDMRSDSGQIYDKSFGFS